MKTHTLDRQKERKRGNFKEMVCMIVEADKPKTCKADRQPETREELMLQIESKNNLVT